MTRHLQADRRWPRGRLSASTAVAFSHSRVFDRADIPAFHHRNGLFPAAFHDTGRCRAAGPFNAALAGRNGCGSATACTDAGADLACGCGTSDPDGTGQQGCRDIDASRRIGSVGAAIGTRAGGISSCRFNDRCTSSAGCSRSNQCDTASAGSGAGGAEDDPDSRACPAERTAGGEFQYGTAAQ